MKIIHLEIKIYDLKLSFNREEVENFETHINSTP